MLQWRPGFRQPETLASGHLEGPGSGAGRFGSSVGDCHPHWPSWTTLESGAVAVPEEQYVNCSSGF